MYNDAETAGGGIYTSHAGHFVIKSNSFVSNNENGLCLNIKHNDVDHSFDTVELNIFLNNTNIGNYYGGAISVGSVKARLTNNLYAGNEDYSYGGAIGVLANDCTLTSETITDNEITSANGTGGGVYVDATGCSIVNCIIWGNSSDNIDELDYPASPAGKTPTVSHSNVDDPNNVGVKHPSPTTPATNLYIDPEFDDEGNYRLSDNNCLVVDSGDNGATYIISVDIDGETRIVAVRILAYAYIDMGADEMQN